MNKEHLLPIEKSKLGVIGGSGFYSMDQIEYSREIEINTPYGKPVSYTHLTLPTILRV